MSVSVHIRNINGGVVAATGFSAAGVVCGIKTARGAPDVALIVSDLPAVAAGMFTTNRVQAAPVLVTRDRIRGRKVRGIVANSGNANACTGMRGFEDAIRMAEVAARCTRTTPERILVASTGVIGQPLPMSKVESGIQKAALRLGRCRSHASAVARAIMTTDTVPKSAAVEVRIGGKRVRIGGIAKGAGMISPKMATLLAFITTDCAVTAPMLRKALREAVGKTFNCITVDGDASTNDTIVILANGAAGNAAIRRSGRPYNVFLKGLLTVSEKLAQGIVRDGEGATRFVEVHVTAGRSRGEAERVARQIANSPLVKTAIHGGDPNWGRIICAAGHAGPPVQPDRMRLRINGVQLFRCGTPCRVRPDRLAACMKPKDIKIRLDLGRGKGAATIWTCDLSKEYVSINADYHT